MPVSGCSPKFKRFVFSFLIDLSLHGVELVLIRLDI